MVRDFPFSMNSFIFFYRFVSLSNIRWQCQGKSVKYFETGDQDAKIKFHVGLNGWSIIIFFCCSELHLFDTQHTRFIHICLLVFAHISLRFGWPSMYVMLICVCGIYDTYTKIRQIKGIIKITNKCAIFISTKSRYSPPTIFVYSN